MQRRAIWTLPLALLALAAAGCGGGEKSGAPTAVPATTTSLSALASATNCRRLADLGTKFSEAVGGAGDSRDLKKTAQLLQEFAARTPESIRPDFTLIADAYAKVADAVGTIEPGTTPGAEALAKLQKLSGEIDATRLSQASVHISAWLQDNCAP